MRNFATNDKYHDVIHFHESGEIGGKTGRNRARRMRARGMAAMPAARRRSAPARDVAREVTRGTTRRRHAPEAARRPH